MSDKTSLPPSVLIVQQSENASTDFYLESIKLYFRNDVEIVNFNQIDDISLNGRDVVFIRYLYPEWQKLLESERSDIHGIYFFIDDDLFDLKAIRTMPLAYQWKLFRLAYVKHKWLKRNRAKLLVSTPYLREKYKYWIPDVILPKSPFSCSVSIRVFYHGSASHKAEIEWLYKLMCVVLSKSNSIHFEILGGTAVNKLFKSLPRVTIIHPMDWSNYKAFISLPGRHIGLAPLLDGEFNNSRSFTKFFDITQAGAVGIYAKHPVYQAIVKHQENGLLLEMDAEIWADKLFELANNERLRQMLYQSAKSTVDRLNMNKSLL